MDAIFTAARDLILRQGTGANLMTAIAARSGISRQRLYQYFPNLEELLGVLMQDTAQRVYGHLRALYGQFGNVRPAEGVRLCLEAGLGYLCSSEPLLRDDVLLLGLLDLHVAKNGGLPGLEEVEALRRSASEPLVQLAAAGQREGAFRTDLTAESLAAIADELLLGTANRLQLGREKSLASPELRADLVQTLVRFFQGSAA